MESINEYQELMNEDESIKSMKNSSSHILALLTNLLDLSSLEQGKLLLNNTEFGVKELCREVYEMFLPLAKNKHLNLDFECTDIMISSDKIKIKQLLINLVSNAIKYSSEGDVFFEVIFKDNNLSIIVEDTGIGIPQEKMDKLFKPFSR